MRNAIFIYKQLTRTVGCLVLAVQLLWPAEASALDALLQDPESTPSDSSQLWSKPPAHSRCEILFRHETSATGSSAASDPSYRPFRVTLTRHGRDMDQEVLMEDGKRWETWNLGGIQLQSLAGKDTVWLRPPNPKLNGTADTSDYHAFGEFNWIRKEHFRGTFPVQNTRAHVYLFPLKDTSPETLQRLRAAKKGPLGALPLCDGVLAAAIHPETKHPLLLQQGAQIRTYTISPLPTGALIIPPKVSRFRHRLSAPARVAPRPLP